MKSISYGAANLLKEPLRISNQETSELQIGLGMASTEPWVRVSGWVRGFDPAQGPLRVGLESNTTSTIEAAVNPDGSFQFQSVLKQTTYNVKLVPANDAAVSPRVAVSDKDVDSVEIVVPGVREVLGIITMEGGGAIPGFQLGLLTVTGGMSIRVQPERNGTFRVKLPIDERRVRVNGLPIGYVVKAMTYGASDLLTQPLNLTEPSELHLTLSVDPDVKPGSVKGRLIGLDPNHGSVQVVLNGVTAFTSFESGIDSFGNFSFADVPQGAYALSVQGAGAASLNPSSIVISGIDVSGLEVAVLSSTAARSLRPDQPSGATVSDLGGGSPEANESAAVAGMRTINTAEVGYLSMSGGKYESVADLMAAKLLNERFLGPVNGFVFSVMVAGPNYVIAAVPVSADAGRFAFYSTPDGVIRYSASEFLAPAGQMGLPVQ